MENLDKALIDYKVSSQKDGLKGETSFRSTKRFSGYSTCFRQWRATHSHCRFLHGYDIEFKITFEGELDNKNWVADFGGFKLLKDEFNRLFDHTTVVAQDDPQIEIYQKMHNEGLCDLRILEDVGCERFAELVFFITNQFINLQTFGRVRVVKVECFENNTNSAIFKLK